MPVTSGAQSTEANLNATTPAAPAASVNVNWQAGAPYADPNNPSFQVRDISANVPLDTDGTLAANSDSHIASQKATKTYADTKATPAGVQSGSYDYAADTGAANAYAVTLSPVPTLAAGLTVIFKAANANTTTSTLAVNGLAAKTIKKLDGATNLASGDIAAGQIVTCVYDGTNFQMESPVANVSAGGTGTVTHTGGALTAHAVVVGNGGSDAEVIAALGTAGQYLRSGGAGVDPAFASIAESEVTNLTTDLAAKVAGPASAVDVDFAVFDGTTGKLIKDSGWSRDTDGTLAANSDLRIATQKAVKTYVNSFAPGGAGSLLLKTNSVNNGSQALLNLIAGLGITLTDDGIGDVTIAGGFAWGGDGSDGALTFDGSSTVLGLVPAASVYTLTRDIFGTNITVNSGVTIKAANWAVFATGTLTVNGTLMNDGTSVSGNGGQGGAGGTGSGGGGSAGGASNASSNPAGDGHYLRPGGSTAGGAGGAGTSTTGTQAPSPSAPSSPAAGQGVDGLGVAGSTGSSGGAGGAGASGAGGAARAGSSGSSPSSNTQAGKTPGLAVSGYGSNVGSVKAYQPSNGATGTSAGGSGGGGDGTNLGGGGGGAGGTGPTGGLLVVSAPTIVVGAAGIISAKGGPGANGGNGGSPLQGNTGGGGGGAGGSGGTGGILWMIYHKLTNSGTISVAGGSGGTHGNGGTAHGTGTNGSNGADGVAGATGNLIQMVN